VTLEIQHGRSLASLNTLGLNVRAEHYVSVGSEPELMEALSHARTQGWAVTVLGGGSNLVCRGDLAGLVLHVGIPGILYQDESVEAGAGENWHHLVLSSLEQGLSGLENLSLIPGSVGAAPIQNIGAYGAELSMVFESLVAIDRSTLETVNLDAAECRFGYRDSIFKGELHDQLVICRVSLRLSRDFQPNLEYQGLKQALDVSGVTVTAERVSEAVCALRRSKLPDPDVQGNVGSFFKNPVVSMARVDQLRDEYPDLPCWPVEGGGAKVSAAWLIERCGLKGKRQGGAAISEQHSLVIVNRDGATGEDVIALASLVQQEISARFDIALEIEPRIY